MKLDKILEDKLLLHIEEENGLDVGEYQNVNLFLFGRKSFKEFLTQCKFKRVGNIYEMLDYAKRPNYIDGFSAMKNFKHNNCVYISKKYKTILIYTRYDVYYDCILISNVKKVPKISKILKPIIESEYSMDNAFENVDFKCDQSMYIEVTEPTKDDEKIKTVKRKVTDENLVFDDNSTLSDILKDVKNFFNKDTKKLYDQLQIPYKRGLMLYGPPGNGKSALIREVIRTTPVGISKVVLDTNLRNFTQIFSLLVQKINGEPTILIIEDIDSVINPETRSMFLNILDGVHTTSGLFIIGTTNYIERLDSALINRSGRFDKPYEVLSPSATVRREYFKRRNLDKILSEYKVKPNSNKKSKKTKSLVLTQKGREVMGLGDSPVIEIFTKYTNELPMANLKEVMINTQYLLANDKKLSVEEAVKKSTSIIKKNMKEHNEKSNRHNNGPMNNYGGFNNGQMRQYNQYRGGWF